MIISSKTLTLSGAWLIGRAKSMARDMLKRGPRYASKQSVLDGYLIQAKRTGNIGSSNIIDPAAFLAVSGSYNIGDLAYFDLSYIQQLDRGRDSYLPGAISQAQDPQTDPILFAVPNGVVTIGTGGGDKRLATRLWGVAQPFTSVGFAYGYGAVYTSLANSSWALAYAREDDTFAYYINILAPAYFRAVTTEQDGSFAGQGNSSATQANWTFQISESVLRESGATAFIRRLGIPTENYESNWDYMQYPWMTFSEPHFYSDDNGDPALELLVVGQVVYEEAGPYYTDDSPEEYGWSPTVVGYPIASGAKGLWAGRVVFEKGEANVVDAYVVNGLSSSDEHRQPQQIFRPAEPSSPQVDAYWYQNNFHYKSSPVRLDSGVYVMVDGSSVMKYDPTADEQSDTGTTAFVDVRWFTGGGGQRSQNMKTTKLEANYHYTDGTEISNSTHIYFDAGQDEMRWVVGSATDGEVMVSPAFSSFRPGDSPMLHVIVADKDSASIAYSGNPGFAMVMCGLLDEAAAIQYVEDPVYDPDDPDNNKPPRTMTVVAGDGQVTYMGNGKFAFYVSTEWNTPPPTSTAGGARGNLAVATYKRGGGVELAGVIDPDIPDYTLNTSVEGFAFTQTMFSDRVGRIEVVRLESDDYQKGERGNPATLIATRGWGAPSLNFYTQSGKDIKNGTTWISYDSGETWTVMLNYGSPAGVFHCGNTLAPRSDPIVRI